MFIGRSFDQTHIISQNPPTFYVLYTESAAKTITFRVNFFSSGLSVEYSITSPNWKITAISVKIFQNH